MSQETIMQVLTDIPQTQKEIDAQVHLGSGRLCHRLNNLIKSGLVARVVLDRKYRPFGYIRTPAREAVSGGRSWRVW